MNLLDRFRILITGELPQPEELASVTAQVDDSSGWTSLTGRPHDYDQAQIYEIYQDSLLAWRKNPIAWRIINITSDYVVGDAIDISSPNRNLNNFITKFWNHPKNNFSLRLPAMCDELSRAGDLFVLLFRNDQDGMSYVRFVTKDRIVKIETSPNDWETEIAYHEQQDTGDPKVWLSPYNPASNDADAIMLHYSVNRPIGALMGESDLTTMIPWLMRYSRMLEDRVRLHWAVRAFLWLVTVPSNKVHEKREQYRNPPEAGSIIVKDESETWDVATPTLRGADAAHDLRAVRGMIDAGSGYPPHWREYFVYILQDVIYQSYQRSLQLGRSPKLKKVASYQDLFSVSLPDISRSDNETLARSARDISTGIQTLSDQLPGESESYIKQALRMFYLFSGEPQSEESIEEIYNQALSNPHPENIPGETQSDNQSN
jgi:hypothetical protein